MDVERSRSTEPVVLVFGNAHEQPHKEMCRFIMTCHELALLSKECESCGVSMGDYFDFAEANVIQRIAELRSLVFCTCLEYEEPSVEGYRVDA